MMRGPLNPEERLATPQSLDPNKPYIVLLTVGGQGWSHMFDLLPLELNINIHRDLQN